MGKSKDPDKATIVLFSGELDRALAAFNIAIAAALMGSQVTIFFTFWGLNVIRKRRPRSSNVVPRRMSSPWRPTCFLGGTTP